ncbi:glucosaminidase domain-containing protein [Gallaecimonas sp. GXIMD4217]|uniref:glucosaminidase domain-containing protein n=1 Tax=Gallaecimonas sp. GXIMD4217 TaxID=3131927 RepID=UPI00311B2EAE
MRSLHVLKAPLLLLALLAGVLLTLRQPGPPPARDAKLVDSQLPDFGQYDRTTEKKKAFFAYLKPLVEAENARILAERARLESVLDKAEPSEAEQHWLAQLASDYELTWPLDEAGRQELLSRVDILPLAMVLAQAANESAWGNSRFARQGYNFFGQWCYQPGCGLVPLQRGPNQRHEVARFDSPQDSVRSYLHNINTHGAYRELRAIRAAQRQAGETPRAGELVWGLLSYSERREDYVQELLAMIRHNRRYMDE